MLRRIGLAKGLARASFQRLSVPLKVSLSATYRCQYRCKTCNIWARRPVDELTTEELLHFIDQNEGVRWLDVTGGEIFLRDDIEVVLEAVVANWRRLAILHFPTNGFQTDRIVRAVKHLAGMRTRGDLVVTVSLDGYEALNDKIRGIGGGYQRQVETFRRLRELSGVCVYFGMTLSRYNVAELEKTIESCRIDCPGVTVDDFHVNVAQVSGHYYGNEGGVGDFLGERQALGDALRRFRSLRGAAMSLRKRLEDRYIRHLERYVETGCTPMRCHALRTTCFVDPWGTVYPCITYGRPLGSLREHDMNLEPIWNSDEAVRLQAEIWEGECPQCWTACEAYPSILGNVLRQGR